MVLDAEGTRKTRRRPECAAGPSDASMRRLSWVQSVCEEVQDPVTVRAMSDFRTMNLLFSSPQ